MFNRAVEMIANIIFGITTTGFLKRSDKDLENIRIPPQTEYIIIYSFGQIKFYKSGLITADSNMMFAKLRL
jgi:hypothetical protein